MTPAAATARRRKAAPAPATVYEQLSIDIPREALGLQIRYLARNAVHPDPAQPRQEADAELRASIARGGIRQPITVRLADPFWSGHCAHCRREWAEIAAKAEHVIIDGERRWRGADGVQETIPCVIRRDQDDERERLRTQLVSNTGKPLTPMEEARAYARMVQLHDGNQTAAADELGVPRTTLNERLKLLELGPWAPLLDAGLFPISWAMEHLAPLRTLPEASHLAALRSMLHEGDSFDPASARTDESLHEFFRELSPADFLRAVEDAYGPLMYPLTKAAAGFLKQPEFSTKDHATECSCGGVKWHDRLHCGNPEYWKPRHRKAVAEKKKAEKAVSDVVRNVADRSGPRLVLPDGTPTKTHSVYALPKTLAALTTTDGTWAVPRHRQGFAEAFDPKDLDVDVRKLVRVKPQGGGGRFDVVATTDAAAVTRARDAWQARWRTRRHQLEEKVGEELAQAPLRHSLAADETVLRTLAGSFAEDELTDLVIVAACLRIPISQDLHEEVAQGDCYDLVALARPWLGTLSREQLTQLLTGYVEYVAADLKSPYVQLQTEQSKALEGIGRRKVPWIVEPGKEPKPPAPKGAKAKGKGKGNGAAAPAPGSVSMNQIEDSPTTCTKCRRTFFEPEDLVDGLCVECEDQQIFGAAKEDEDLWDAPSVDEDEEPEEEPEPTPPPKRGKKGAARTPAFAQLPLQQPSPALAAIVGATPRTRADITTRVWDYIKKHGLQDSKEKRIINADEKLRPVFGEDRVTMFEMTKHLNAHCTEVAGD